MSFAVLGLSDHDPTGAAAHWQRFEANAVRKKAKLESEVSALLVEPAVHRVPADSVSIAVAALDLCRSTRAAVLATTIVGGPALLVGARQRPERFSEDTPRFARRSTGREARVQNVALYHVLALPALDALVRDARAENFLNRYVRSFLAGYRSLGSRADYLGRDVVRIDRQNAGRLGYDVEADGLALLELIVDYVGNDAAEAARCIASQVAKSYGLVEKRVALAVTAHARIEEPGAACAFAAVNVPIGIVEAGVSLGPPPQVWIGGDLLSSNSALAAVERRAEAVLAANAELDETVLEPLVGMPLDGARAEDVLAALREAQRRAEGLC